MAQSIADELKSIAKSSNLGESLERAHKFAREQSHRLVTLEHLLLALTEDPEAALILQAANVDLGRLRADVSGHLGRLMEDMRGEAGAEPRPDPELLRVLQAAASAAHQSKRRQIDGAIVLAAVVGDGKSPAAGTLKAHGMTFEEAIRALQRANTRARLKTPTKAGAASTGTTTQDDAITVSADVKPATAKVEPVAAHAESLSARLAPHAGTADDILAAARARIQQRAMPAAATSGKADPVDLPEPEPATARDTNTEAPVNGASTHVHAAAPQQTSDAFEELLAVSTAPKAAPPGDGYGLAADAGSRQGWAPPPDMRPGPNARNGGPPPVGRGPRQSTVQRPARPAPGQGHSNRPMRAPWPEPGDANGHPRPMPSGGAQRAGRAGGQSDRGPLLESVPRRMRVGASSKAEVRIARDRIDGLVAALSGQGQMRPDQSVARALSVRLKAPNGGFTVESMSPETQWVETSSGLMQDDHAIWRWTVTPQRRGRGRLQLLVSARTIGHDGLAAESAPPDRVIEVRVAPNRMRRFGRLMAWIILLAAGVALGRYGDHLWGTVHLLIKKALAG